MEQVNLKVKIKKLSKEAVIPKYSVDGDAGMDLTAISVEKLANGDKKYGFGLAFEIPKGYVGLIFPRSSCYKQVQFLSNAVGVIDSGYRGEVSAVMVCGSNSDIHYKVGERVAQIIVMPYPQIEFEEVEELEQTNRGEKGYGSTGK